MVFRGIQKIRKSYLSRALRFSWQGPAGKEKRKWLRRLECHHKRLQSHPQSPLYFWLAPRTRPLALGQVGFSVLISRTSGYTAQNQRGKTSGAIHLGKFPKFPGVTWYGFFRSRPILARNEFRAMIQNGGFCRVVLCIRNSRTFRAAKIYEIIEDKGDIAIFTAVSRSMRRDLNRIQGYFEVNVRESQKVWKYLTLLIASIFYFGLPKGGAMLPPSSTQRCPKRYCKEARAALA